MSEGVDNGTNSPGRLCIRYDTDHLDEFIASRTVDPLDKPQPKHLRPVVRHLTDTEWTAVKARLDAGRTSGPLFTGRHRAVIDEMLDACTAGEWTDPGLQRRLMTGLEYRFWLLKAFAALADFPDFPFVIATQYSIMRRGNERGDRQRAPWSSLTIRTVVHGPVTGKRHNAAVALRGDSKTRR